MASATTAIICTAVLAAMLFLLGLNVSRTRGLTAKAGGPQLPTDPASRLLIAIRAHGNASEYVPTLIVWGDKDATNDVSMAHELHDGIKGSKLVVFEGIGHGVPQEAPDQFVKALNEFL